LIDGAHVAHMVGERSFVLRWRYEDAQTIELQAHLGDTAVAAPGAQAVPWLPLAEAQTIFSVGVLDDQTWQPWSARWIFGREHG
jgi:1,4-alpha-glucan branching enzyme/maltooligosyltrehalose trehalohydrolase